MIAKFAPLMIAASVLALSGAAALAEIDNSLPPVVISQPVPPDRGTNDDTSGGRVFSDQPFTVNGTEVVCTGIDSDSRHDPRWASYPMKLEFAGAGGQFLGEERVVVTGNGVNVDVRCKGPWLLMRVPAGSYSVQASVQGGGQKTVTVRVSGRGQSRTVMSFPQASGETTGTQTNTQ